MERVLPFEITDVGLAAVFDQANTGLKMTLSHIALGKGLNNQPYVPSGTETRLRSEFMRRPIGGGERIAPNEILLQALFDGNETGIIREIGVFTSTGVLFAVWSGAPIGEKYPGVPYIFAQSLVIDGINLERVTWIAGGPNVNIIIAAPFASMSTELLRLQNRALQTDVDRFSATINSTWY